MPRATLGGVNTHWREAGDGVPAALIHCTLAHCGAWSRVMARLEDRMSMVAPDLPDHGASGPASGDYQQVSTAQLADLLEATHGPSHLIGHSFGATVCLRLAVERPDLVLSLMLYEPVFFVFLKDAGDPAYDTHLARSEPMNRALDAGDKEAAARIFTSHWSGTVWDDLPEPQRQYFVDRIHLVSATEGTIVWDGPDRIHLAQLAGIDVPTLLMAGETSDPTITRVNAAIASTIRVSETEVLPGAGHMGPVTHPGPFADRVARFLSL